ALNLTTGEPAWKDLQLPLGSTPSGRGFMTDERYFLPVSSGEVWAVDVQQGKMVDRSRSRAGNVPGNLIAYEGRIVSQTAEALEVFYELGALKQQVAATLEKDPDDPSALARRGALALHDGDTAAAIEDLTRAHELAPNGRTR